MIATAARLSLLRRVAMAGALITAGAVGTAPLDAPAPATTVHLLPGQQVLVIADAAPSPSATPGTSASAGPTASPSPSLAATPAPTLVPPPLATCGSTLQAVVDAAPAGGSIDLGSCVYTAGATVTKALTVSRGTIRQAGTAIRIAANDVTLDGVRFDGGANTVVVDKVDRAKITGSTFVNMRESSIRIIGPSADDVTISGNAITQTINTGHGYSPIAGSAAGGTNRNLHVSGNTIDQGPSGVAWFGIEVWDNTGLVIDGNALKGAGPGLSIPRSDGAVVSGNAFDLSQAFWGMEIADVDNAKVVGNTGYGTSSSGPQWKAFIQLHPGSGTVNGIQITGNRLSGYPALVNAAGAGHVITDNCLASVGQLQWGSWAGPVTIARNGAC